MKKSNSVTTERLQILLLINELKHVAQVLQMTSDELGRQVQLLKEERE